MNFGKRWIAFFMVIGFTLMTACGNNEAEAGDKQDKNVVQETIAGYKEAEIEVPAGEKLLKGWQEKAAMPWQSKFKDENIQLTSIKTLPNGNKIISYIKDLGKDVVMEGIESEPAQPDKNNIRIYNVDNGSQEAQVDVTEMDLFSGHLSGDGAGHMYITSPSGVFKVTNNGLEEVMSDRRTSLGLTELSINQVMITDQVKLIGFCNNFGENVLNSYTYVDNLVNVKKKVDIYSLEWNSMLEQAVKSYEKEHLDTAITIEYGADGKNELTRTDAINKLNKLILAGEGPDMIMMDGLNTENYIRQGVLEDMSSYFTKEEQSHWFEKVAKAYEKDGKLYALPTHYEVPTLWGNQKVLDQIHTMQELVEFVKAHPEQRLFSDQSYEQMIRSLYPGRRHQLSR